jgi:hypothetical protein
LASIINSTDTGSGGLITTGDSSDELQIQTAETTAITITSGQQSVFIAGTAAAPAVTTTGDLNTGIYFPAADNIGFATGGTIRGRWTTDGLCFGSDTAAANALDDYEEGTWTPVLKAGRARYCLAGQLMIDQTGRYTKIGRCVTVSFYFVLSNKGSSSGVATVSLPFSSDEYGQPNQPGYSGGLATYGSMNTASKAGFIVGNIGAAGYINADSSSTAASVATETNFNNNTSFIVTITYNTST